MDDEQPLPLELTFDDRTEYLYARAKAYRTNLATAELYLKQIAEKCVELGRKKLLIYRDITDVLDTSSMYRVTSHLAATLPGVKVAFVNPHASNQHNLEFGRDIIRRTGGTVELFRDEALAINWLLND